MVDSLGFLIINKLHKETGRQYDYQKNEQHEYGGSTTACTVTTTCTYSSHFYHPPRQLCLRCYIVLYAFLLSCVWTSAGILGYWTLFAFVTPYEHDRPITDHGEMLGEHGVWEKQKFFEGSAVEAPPHCHRGERRNARGALEAADKPQAAVILQQSLTDCGATCRF
jgi:hypothetical protein